jgi:membrane protein implicated in regulation of membrane protease activity
VCEREWSGDEGLNRRRPKGNESLRLGFMHLSFVISRLEPAGPACLVTLLTAFSFLSHHVVFICLLLLLLLFYIKFIKRKEKKKAINIQEEQSTTR